MTNYQNEIMNLLEGDTPKQKYDYLKSIVKLMDGRKFLFKIDYHSLFGIPCNFQAAIPAFNKDEALDIFWNGKNKEQYEVTSVLKIDTLIS